MISIDVYSTRAVIRSQEPLTVGLVGGRVQFRFSDQWKSLVKTAVFRQGTVTRDIMGISHQAVIPWEVLQQPGLPVQIGVYGSDSNGKVVIPTVWAVTDPVSEGADPAADVTLPPTPEVTQQLQSQIGSLDQLNTAAKDNLVKAINEANRGCFTVSTNADGTVNRTMPAIQDAYLAGKNVVLFDGGYVAALEGIAKVDAEKTGAENFIYTFRCHDENGVQRVYEVYYKDSKSVFRQYDTKIRAVWRVGVEKKDGVYQANRTVTEMSTAYQDGKNLVCWLGGRELYLIGTDKDGNNLKRFHFSGGSADGSLVQRVTVYAANGSADSLAQASVYSDLPCVDLSGYAMLGKVGIIGDSLSVGVEDHSASESIQNTDHSWGAYLSRTAGNPSLFLGASGASSATFINDGLLDGALKEENRCDAYIVGLGFNDLRNGATVGSIQDITGSDTYTDTNHNATPYGSYYYNIGKILRKLHAFNPDAPIFVLTNPEYISINAELFNQPLRNICAEYGTEYNAHLIDLRGIYGPIFENLEAVRGPRNHFDRQTYAYMGQIIGTAITRDIRKNPGAYPQLKGYLPDEADPSIPARFTVRVDTDTAVNRSVDEMTAAYQAGQSLVLYDNGYVAALEGIGRDSNNKYIYTFRCHDKDGTQKVYTVSSPNVLEKSTVEAGGESGGIEKLVDITTTKYTDKFQIPIDTEEMANKLLNASELHLYLYVPRYAEDIETNTSGNVSVGVLAAGNYEASFVSFEGVIPNPTLDYMKWSTSTAKIFVDTFGGSLERNAIGMKYQYVLGAGQSSSLYHATVDARGFKKDSYIFVNGTQKMAVGTRFVLGVRA